MRIVYFHSLYGDLNRLQRINKIAMSEKAQILICGGDFMNWDMLWIDKYADIVKEICKYRDYVQTFGDQDSVERVTNHSVLKGLKKFHVCLTEKQANVNGQNFICVPYTNDPRFRFKHFYKKEYFNSQIIGDMHFGIGTCYKDCQDIKFDTMSDALEKSGLKIKRETILISHTPPEVPSLVCQDRNMIHRGSDAIAGLIQRTDPMIVLCGHTTNDILELPSCESYFYDIGNSVVFNPGREHVLTLDIRKKQFYYDRVKI